jgi:multiple antibiotic resistance protein
MGNAFVTTFVTVLILLEPMTLVPAFLSLTHRSDKRGRDRAALIGVTAAGIILAVFGVVGEDLLRYLKISLEDIQVAGGVLLLLVMLQIMFGNQSQVEEDDENVAIVPLGIPMLAGPGTIVALLVLLDEYKKTSDRLQIAGAVALALAVLYVLFRFGSVIATRIKPSAARAITRVMGLLIMAIAVHFIASAIGEWTRSGVT